MKAQLELKYELTESPRLGPSPKDGKEVNILNRIVRWTDRGLEYEADPRQAEKLVMDLGLNGAKSVGTPGVKLTNEQLSADKKLGEHKCTAFRGVAARGNYLAADRPDTQYAAKEICRWMASPTEHGVTSLKRLGRYLEGHKRLVIEFPWQDAASIEVYSDTDWSGCIRTRKSTSGGCLMIGKHLVKSWSSTQGPISLSSGGGGVLWGGNGLGHSPWLPGIAKRPGRRSSGPSLDRLDRHHGHLRALRLRKAEARGYKRSLGTAKGTRQVLGNPEGPW